MSGIGVVLNPHSKRYKQAPHLLSRMAFIVGERGHFKATHNLEDLEQVAQQFRDKGIEILAMSGGDGTLHQTISVFLRVYGEQPLPRIALLRGGTLNNVATSCGIRGTPEKLLMRLIYRYHEDQSLPETVICPMKINDQYGFIWGCGVIARFMEAYYGNGRPSSFHAAKTLARTITSALINGRFACDVFRRFDAEVTFNGKAWPYKNYNAIFAGSISELGLGFRLFYRVSEETPFHAIGFSLPPRNVLRYVPRMFLGRQTGCPDLLEDAGGEMSIRLEEPQSYTIDGDMYEPTDYFHITQGPRLNIILL